MDNPETQATLNTRHKKKPITPPIKQLGYTDNPTKKKSNYKRLECIWSRKVISITRNFR